MQIRKIYNEGQSASCYFRTALESPYKKVLLQITEKCNLHCKHCFLGDETSTKEITLETFQEILIPLFLKNNVKKVTLTGGEPLLHNKVENMIELLCDNQIAVSICTNATLITEEFLEKLKLLNSVHFNMSLDGFSENSHGEFRGNNNKDLFEKIIHNIESVAKYGMLNGILVTPNIYCSIAEYIELCEFAKKNHAKYVLMNPLSQFGRGQETLQLGYSEVQLRELRKATEKFNSSSMQMVYIRFPNDNKNLGYCDAGKIMYIFSDGNVTYCPYMVFAANNTGSKYKPSDFIIGNVYSGLSSLHTIEPAQRIKWADSNCTKCTRIECGRGCYADKIARGKLLSEQDKLCPELAKEKK